MEKVKEQGNTAQQLKTSVENGTGTLGGTYEAGDTTAAENTATEGTTKNPAQWPLAGNLRNGATPPTVPSSTYTSPYDQQLQDLYKSITERKPFEYNADDDAMYQQYKDRYMQLGQQAMQDTMGQAAALTGGYGSSYGQAVGQQQYDQYMLGLNDKASELYAQAYQRYQDEGDRQRQNYAMLGDLADRDYNLWSGDYGRQLNDYTLGLDEAAAMAQYGDFSGYAALYGQEAAQSMLASWAAQNPQLAFMQGAITEGQFQNLQLGRPMNEGLDADGNPIGGALGGVGLGGDPWDYGGSGWNGGSYYAERAGMTREHAEQGLAEGMTHDQLLEMALR